MTVTVATSSTRHRTGHRGPAGRRSFVKTARDPAHRGDLVREAAVYGIVRDRCPATAARLPRDVRWNPDSDELEMEAAPAVDLRARVSGAGALEPVVAAEVGRALGEFHAEGGDPGDSAPASLWLRVGVAVARPEPAHLRLFSAGGVKLLGALQRSDALRSRLAALDPPRGDQLAHGDLRWENVLVADETAAASRVWLVDWEMGGAGEHAWDAGCFAAAAVSGWLSSIPDVPGVPPDRLAAEAELPMEALAAGLDLFWSAYRAADPDSATDAWAERCAQLAAVRLVHIGFELTELDLGVRPSAVAHLQVASNVLRDPARAGRDLLGLS
jgi:hypothetical protein